MLLLTCMFIGKPFFICLDYLLSSLFLSCIERRTKSACVGWRVGRVALSLEKFPQGTGNKLHRKEAVWVDANGQDCCGVWCGKAPESPCGGGYEQPSDSAMAMLPWQGARVFLWGLLQAAMVLVQWQCSSGIPVLVVAVAYSLQIFYAAHNFLNLSSELYRTPSNILLNDFHVILLAWVKLKQTHYFPTDTCWPIYDCISHMMFVDYLS